MTQPKITYLSKEEWLYRLHNPNKPIETVEVKPVTKTKAKKSKSEKEKKSE